MTDSISGQDLGSRDRVGITSSLIYGQRPAAVLARKVALVSQANNVTYNPGGLIRVEIPTSPGTFLVCGTTTLKFNLDITSLTGAAIAAGQAQGILDPCASSLIERIRIYSGSSLIEDIGGYNKIFNLMSDVTKNNGETETTGFVEGSPSQPPIAPTIGGATDYENYRDIAACANVRPVNITSDFLYPTQNNPVAADNVPYQFEIPIMSGTIGTMCPKWLPLSGASSAPIRCEIELASRVTGMIQTTDSRDTGGAGVGALTWSLSNVELHADIVQLDANAMRLVEESVGGQFTVNTSTFRHSQSVVAAGSTSSSNILPFRFSSAKAFLTRAYDQASAAGAGALVLQSQSMGLRNNTTRFHHMIGSSHVPANSVQCGNSEQTPLAGAAGGSNRTNQPAVEAVTELMKAVHGKNILQLSNHINVANWNHNVAPAIAAGAAATPGWLEPGTFTYGVDLESQGKASALIENGTSTVSLQCFLNVDYDVATQQAVNLHSWCLHDLRLDFVGGVIIPRY